MGQNVMITGTGRSYALGFNLVLRYLEAGDRVVATVRRESEALLQLIQNFCFSRSFTFPHTFED